MRLQLSYPNADGVTLGRKTREWGITTTRPMCAILSYSSWSH